MTPRRVTTSLSFGGRIPWGLGLVLAITIGLSIAAALGDRGEGSVFRLASLQPAAVLRGQVWRLFTWSFVEIDPIWLILNSLFLYWFGGDLARAYGSRRFLTLYASVALTGALLTCLVTAIAREGEDHVFLGGWAIGCAMTVGWGFSFPDRIVRLYFLVPIRGIWIARLTLAATGIFATYRGWVNYLPEIGGEAAMLVWVFRGSFAGLRTRWAKRGQTRRADVRARKRAEAASYLRVVEAHDDDEPKLSPEVEKKLDDLLRSRAKRDRSRDN